jgi:hypothetical protein
MKSLISKIIRPVAQTYANFLISRLEVCDNLFEYQSLMEQAVLLDYICTEDFNIYLD